MAWNTAVLYPEASAAFFVLLALLLLARSLPCACGCAVGLLCPRGRATVLWHLCERSCCPAPPSLPLAPSGGGQAGGAVLASSRRLQGPPALRLHAAVTVGRARGRRRCCPCCRRRCCRCQGKLRQAPGHGQYNWAVPCTTGQPFSLALPRSSSYMLVMQSRVGEALLRHSGELPCRRPKPWPLLPCSMQADGCRCRCWRRCCGPCRCRCRWHKAALRCGSPRTAAAHPCHAALRHALAAPSHALPLPAPPPDFRELERGFVEPPIGARRPGAFTQQVRAGASSWQPRARLH